ncbi:MAG: deoxyribose-phosphate aldolase [Terriglobales bacterium]
MTDNAKLPGRAVNLAQHIQSTLISNRLTEALWEKHVQQCVEYRFQACMIPAAWVKRTADALRGSGIRTASFVDLPYGTMTSAGKAYETARIIDDGGEEVDLMPNVGFLLSGMEKEYAHDIRGVVEAAQGRPVKIMLELPLLNTEQRQGAIELSVDAGASYLKNASGGAVGIATPEDIRFLRGAAPAHVRVKASGGIKTAQQVRDLLAAGADLVGTSAAVAIVKQARGERLPAQSAEAEY